MATLTPMASDIPPDLKCGICLDIAIDPVVPASTSTEDKTEMICKHFLCRTCEFINKTHVLKTSEEINCSQCRKTYQEVMPDDETADKIKDFVKKQPHLFNNESYDKLVEARKDSIPIVVRINDAINHEKYDAIEKIASQITDSREKSRVLFNLVIKQIKKGNIKAAKIFANLIPQTTQQIAAAQLIIASYLSSGNLLEAENYILTLPDNSIKRGVLAELIHILQQTLLGSDLSVDQKQSLFEKILKYIDINAKLPSEFIEVIDKFYTLFSKGNLYYISGKIEESKKYLEKAQQQLKKIPDGAAKCIMLLSSIMQLKIIKNEDATFELLTEFENKISTIKLKQTILSFFHFVMLSFYAQEENLKKMEFYAQKFPEKVFKFEDILNDIAQEIKLSKINKNPEAAARETRELMSESFKKMGITESFPRMYALYAVGEAYLGNNDIENGLRILKELHPIPEDFPPITFFGNDIDLKNAINTLVKSTYEKMFRNKNLSACEQIERSKLLTEEEIQEINQKVLIDEEELAKASLELEKAKLEEEKASLELEKASLELERAKKWVNCIFIPLTGLVLSFLAYTALNLNKQN
ncbi:MAG: hypothetical protein K940chlam5_01586 [Candidatus Anoxychlamydiales bacterium]|nr:hypothetical protein [Candidatus Anoxychlamydiales bacterium]